MQPHVEFLRYGYPKVEEEWVPFEVAVNGQLASFSIHESDWRSYSSDAEARAMVIRQAQHYLTEYGDFREKRRN